MMGQQVGTRMVVTSPSKVDIYNSKYKGWMSYVKENRKPSSTED